MRKIIRGLVGMVVGVALIVPAGAAYAETADARDTIAGEELVFLEEIAGRPMGYALGGDGEFATLGEDPLGCTLYPSAVHFA